MTAQLAEPPPGKECSTDLDCAGAESCRAGRCDAPRAFGAPCGGEEDCATGVCSDGRCGCGPGYRFAPRRGCVSIDWCTGAGDCAQPPDACHQAAGGCASSMVCVYPPIACPAGQACESGQCRPAPLKFAVEAVATPVERWGAANDGGTRFRGTLTNLSDQPLSVAAIDAGPIEVSLARDGAPLPPSAVPARFHGSPGGAQVAALVTLAPGAQTTFSIAQPGYLNAWDGQVLAQVTAACEPGKYRATFSYRYGGPAAGRPNVWRGLVAAEPVEFTVE